MKCKGLTRVDVSTLIVLIPLLVVVLLLFPTRTRKIDSRIYCGTNLYVIGKAIQLYCDDYEEKFPRAGGPNSVWARLINNWRAKDVVGAYGLDPNGTGGQASISSCLYLLVKYAELTPRSFICRGDSGTKIFNPVDYGIRKKDLTTLWDFGKEPEFHVSYSYHTPFNEYALTTSSDPGMAVLADRNPWITSKAAEQRRWKSFNPYTDRESMKKGNSVSHNKEGQNVLFNDGHVDFEEEPFCGVNNDNIYTFCSYFEGYILKGNMPMPYYAGSKPQDETDSLLVHDGEWYMPIPIRPEGMSIIRRQNQRGFSE